MLVQGNIRRVKKLGVVLRKSGRGLDITLQNHNSRDNSALHNPPFSRSPTRLFITGGQELKSSEGTTHGDPLSMAIYAVSLQPLITRLRLTTSTKQCWFADDASGAGTAIQLKEWWDTLTEDGPDYGYYPKDEKCWLIAKPEKEEIIRATFKETEINITNEGKKHLGAAVGTRSYLTEYVNEKVEE